MWPLIQKKNNLGINFDESFWSNWGPSDMFYYNEDIFLNKQDIKSIYCMYTDHSLIDFKKEEIAMGLCYQCGDFGEHTVLFSYQENPSLVYKHHWDFIVYDKFSSDNDYLLELWKKTKNKKIFFEKSKMLPENNDLNMIFKNTLDYFKNDIYITKEKWVDDFDFILGVGLVPTGKKVKDFVKTRNKLVMSENGKATLVEIEFEKPSNLKTDNSETISLQKTKIK